MRNLLIATVAFGACACSSSSSTPATVYGTWIYSTNTYGLALTLNADNTYTGQQLVLTSSSSANDQVETGVATITSSTITLTPQKWSCRGPDPADTATYSLNGDTLDVAYSTGAVAFQRNTTPPSANFQVSFGCFDANGAFTPMPLAPVGP